MVTLRYNPIDQINTQQIFDDINKYNPTNIIIFNELEWELKQLTTNLMDFITARGIDIKIIFGSFDCEYYDNFCETSKINKSNLIFWPTFWTNWSAMCLKNEIDYTKHIVDTNFKYPFICLNNKNHVHRQALIDHLAKYDLIDKGVVTWHKFSNVPSQHKFNYYNDVIRIIDDDFTTKLDSFLIPKQWHESFFHVIGEATINVDFISEKTIIPILLKKPFAVISTQGWNKRLLELGFKLYDEIIDYSYDSFENVADRADVLCKSVSKINSNYKELYESIRPKIEYNYNRCLEIIHDKTFIPQIIIDRVNSIDEKNMSTDPRYEHMVRMAND